MFDWIANLSLPPGSTRGEPLPRERFDGRHVYGLASFRELLRHSGLGVRHELERWFATRGDSFFLPGRCAVCARATRFWVDRQYGFSEPGSAALLPNWRERLICEHCQLNNRMRAALHYLFDKGSPRTLDPIYLTEQVTPLYSVLKQLCSNTVGSEYLGASTAGGATDARGVRNETLTALTFADHAFRYLLTFDVLEHVPDTDAALSECRRVLQPGGLLLFTVPFDFNSETTLRRASVRDDGSIEHHAPPEYHGDPLNEGGILSFYTFGWDLLSRLEEHGFAQASAFVYWDDVLGYLGGHQVLFTARAG